MKCLIPYFLILIFALNITELSSANQKFTLDLNLYRTEMSSNPVDVYFFQNVENGKPPYYYYWSFNNVPMKISPIIINYDYILHYVSNRYKIPGNYNMELKVIDSKGQVAKASSIVNIYDSACIKKSIDDFDIGVAYYYTHEFQIVIKNSRLYPGENNKYNFILEYSDTDQKGDLRFKIINKSIEISRASTKNFTDLTHIDFLENCGLGGVIMESNSTSMIIKNFPFYDGIENYKLEFILNKEDLENWILKLNTLRVDYYI